MVGSKNRIIETFKQMTNLGYKREKLLQINTPIGLDLGAKSPEEIAVSIISEIISHRYGTSGKPLKLTKLDWI